MHFTQIKEWWAGQSEEPTWRDGLEGSDRTYVVVAVPRHSQSYQSIVVGRPNTTTAAIKFYPSVAGVGIEPRVLKELGFGYYCQRSLYERYRGTFEQIRKLLAGLDPEQWVVAPLDQIEPVVREYKGRDSSRTRHPMDEDFVVITPTADTGGIKLDSAEQADADKQTVKFSPPDTPMATVVS